MCVLWYITEYLFKARPFSLVTVTLIRKKSTMTTLLLCLSLLIAAVQFSTVDSALPCDSPLRRLLPHRFTHCPSCSYGQWSRWTIAVSATLPVDHTCDSGRAKKYERSKTAIPGSTCTSDTVKEYKYECKQVCGNINGSEMV